MAQAIELQRLVAVLEARFTKYERDLAKVTGRTEASFKRIERRGKQMERQLGASFGGLAGQFRGFAAAVGVGLGARGFQQLADAAVKIRNALALAGVQGTEQVRVYEALYASAQRYATPLEALGQLYGRVALAQKELNASTDEMLNFTNNVAMALRVSGRSAEEARGALLQLGQAMGAGIVRAEEFNSILEGALPIAQATARGLKEAGGSVAALRRLIIDGKVSSEAFFRAFEAGSDILEEKVANAGFTTEQQLVRLNNALIDTVGKFDKSVGVTTAVGRALGDLANTVKDVGNYFEDNEPRIQKFFATLEKYWNKMEENKHSWREWLGLDALDDFLEGTSLIEGRIGFLSQQTRGDSAATTKRWGFLSNQTAADGREHSLAGAFAGLKQELGPPAPRPPVSLEQFPVAPAKDKAEAANRFDNEIRRIEERTAALQTEAKVRAGLNPLVEGYEQELAKAAAKQRLLAAAQSEGIKITPELEARIDALAASYVAASTAADELERQHAELKDQIEEFKRSTADVMTGFISDIREGTSATEALGNALNRIADRLIDMAVNNLVENAFAGLSGAGGGAAGGMFGGAIIPGVLHKGGVAGRDGYGHGRAVSSGVFSGARRYHTGGVAGLRPGEVPAILQRGEIVLPKGTRSSGNSAPNVTVQAVFNVQNGTPEGVEKLKAEMVPLMKRIAQDQLVQQFDRNARFARSKI